MILRIYLINSLKTLQVNLKKTNLFLWRKGVDIYESQLLFLLKTLMVVHFNLTNLHYWRVIYFLIQGEWDFIILFPADCGMFLIEINVKLIYCICDLNGEFI